MAQPEFKSTSLTVSFIGIFAAVYVIASLLPAIPVVAVPGMSIQLGAATASVIGIILGPYLGALAAFIGTIVAFFYRGASIFDLIFILNPALNALTLGLIFRNKWKHAFVLFALIIAAFWLTPPVIPLNTYWYVGLAATFDKIVALFLIPVVARLLKAHGPRVEEASVKFLGKALPIFFFGAFIGNQADSALGSLIFALPIVYGGLFGPALEPTAKLLGLSLLDFVRYSFTVSPFIYPVIRIIQALIASIVAAPLVKVLKTAGLFRTQEKRC
ncbi:ECF transporter S component [Candidatus Bathyarchaeota archaeon]|nr:ECF transporter S component [Candidatus Bathyarchaeota archaeon]